LHFSRKASRRLSHHMAQAKSERKDPGTNPDCYGRLQLRTGKSCSARWRTQRPPRGQQYVWPLLALGRARLERPPSKTRECLRVVPLSISSAQFDRTAQLISASARTHRRDIPREDSHRVSYPLQPAARYRRPEQASAFFALWRLDQRSVSRIFISRTKTVAPEDNEQLRKLRD
jgi:hypothetical protein